MTYNEAEVREGYQEITRLLIRRKRSITTMESCTAGLLATLLTNTEGSSGILKGAFVTYSNEAKIRAGVPAEVIRKYGVYSEETAAEMAKACRAAFHADIGIGVTGSFGNPDPANADSVPGRIFFALDFGGRVTVFSRELLPAPSRYEYKTAAAALILSELRKLLAEELQEES